MTIREFAAISDGPPENSSPVASRRNVSPAHVAAGFRLTSDVVTVLVAVVLGSGWAAQAGGRTAWGIPFAVFLSFVVFLHARAALYRRGIAHRFVDDIGPIELAVALAALSTAGVLALLGQPGQPEAVIPHVWACAAVLVPGGRLLLLGGLAVARRFHRDLSVPTLIVGNGRIAHQICHRLESSPEYGLTPAGLLSVDPLMWTGSDDDVVTTTPRLGPPEMIAEAIGVTGAGAVIIAFSRARDADLIDRVLRVAQARGLVVWVVPRMFDAVGLHARVDHLGGMPLLAVPRADPRGWTFHVKHTGDRVVAALLLLALAPLMLFIAALVHASSPGPILFRQRRVGRDGVPFDCLKFRSMRPPSEADGVFELLSELAPGGVEGVDRRTAVGRMLRSTSLDELPQLINVVKGEMSMVGPRPERPDFVDIFDAKVNRYGERHRVKAGITGWAQVHGLRGQTSIADRAEWDNYYIENWSLGLDLKILALTVPAVLRRAT